MSQNSVGNVPTGRPDGLKGSCLSASDVCIDTISENHIMKPDLSAKSTVRPVIAFVVPYSQ